MLNINKLAPALFIAFPTMTKLSKASIADLLSYLEKYDFMKIKSLVAGFSAGHQKRQKHFIN